MASTYSSTLRLELIGNGDQSGTWGDTTNINLGSLIESAITNVVDITFANATYTLTAYNGLPDEARNAVLNLIGTNSASQNLIAPSVEKVYIVKNATGAQVTIKTSSGTGVAVANGATSLVFCDGTDFFPGALPYGTGTGSGSVVYSNSPTLTGTPLAPTAAAGTNTTQIATTAFVLANGLPSGSIILWSGSVGSVPSGFYLCDGTNSTPDLRDKFIVGAGSTYSVGGTGGSADAIVVSHTHTATSSVTDPGHFHTVFANPGGGSGAFGGGSSGGATNINSDTKTTGISVSTSVASSGSSGTGANLPPYYALCYIMKA